jgi:hypothetical protein
MLDELASVLDSVTNGETFPHLFYGNKPDKSAVLLWNMARKMPIEVVSALVQRSEVHYNRNEWMRAYGWNAGCVRRIH